VDDKKGKGKWEKDWDEVRVRSGLMEKIAEFLRSKRARELALTSNRAVVEYCVREFLKKEGYL
jgi:hypothetical protein